LKLYQTSLEYKEIKFYAKVIQKEIVSFFNMVLIREFSSKSNKCKISTTQKHIPNFDSNEMKFFLYTL
jgi:hypothetical protein